MAQPSTNYREPIGSLRGWFRYAVLGVLLLSTAAGVAVSITLLWPKWRIRQETLAFLDQFEWDDSKNRDAQKAAIRKIGPKSVPTLLGELQSNDDERYLQSLWALAELGSQAETALPELTRLLRHRSPSIRGPLVWAIGEISPEPEPFALPALIQKLDHPDRSVRRRAVLDIGRMRTKAEPAVPALVQLLQKDADSGVRGDAAWALGLIEDRAVTAVPQLIAALDDPDADVRCWAAMSLAAMGPAGEPALERLVQMLGDPSPAARSGAAHGLGGLNAAAEPAVPRLIRLLDDPDEYCRCEAAMTLGRIGPAARSATEALSRTIQDPHPLVRVYSAIALGLCAPDSPSVVPALVEGLEQNPQRQFQSCAWVALGRCGSAANQGLTGSEIQARLAQAARSCRYKTNDGGAVFHALGQMGTPALPALSVAMKDQDPLVRWQAVEALGRIGPPAASMLGAVRLAMDDPNGEVRYAASEVLAKIAPESTATLERLIDALKDNRVHQGTARALAGMGAAALPDIVKTLEHGDANQRSGAAWALGMMASDAKPAVTALIEAARQPDDLNLAWWAVWSLGEIGADAADAVPVLLDRIKDDPSDRDSQRAIVALVKIGAAAVPALAQFVDTAEPEVRLRAALALSNIGRNAGSALPCLIHALTSDDVTLCRAAARAIGAIGPQAIEAIPPLILKLRSADDETRAAACESLGRIGPEAMSAVPRLIDLLRDRNEDVRNSACYALAQMGHESPEAVQALADVLHTRETPAVRKAAVRALGEIGLPAVPALIDSLPAADDVLRGQIVWALSVVGRDGVPAIAEALREHPHPVVRSAAAEALGEIRADQGFALSALVTALQDPSEPVRRESSIALSRIGRAAVPTLEAALIDQNPLKRQWAAKALDSIRRKSPDIPDARQ
jgi:HEAT repeat protein